MSHSIIDLRAVQAAPLKVDPFPFVVIPQFFQEGRLAEIARDFPKIEDPGSIPLNHLKSGEVFSQLVNELRGTDLRDAIAEKFGIDLNGRPTLITVRGKTRNKDGRIHADTKSKLVTLLLYFNPKWSAEGGRLRILRNSHSLEDYVTEIPPTLGTCLIFRVTENCWHGHKPFEGVRRAIQMNYLIDQNALNKHLSRHGFSANLKAFARRLLKPNAYTE